MEGAVIACWQSREIYLSSCPCHVVIMLTTQFSIWLDEFIVRSRTQIEAPLYNLFMIKLKRTLLVFFF